MTKPEIRINDEAQMKNDETEDHQRSTVSSFGFLVSGFGFPALRRRRQSRNRRHLLRLQAQRDKDVPHPLDGQPLEKLRREIDRETRPERHELLRQLRLVQRRHEADQLFHLARLQHVQTLLSPRADSPPVTPTSPSRSLPFEGRSPSDETIDQRTLSH